MASNRRLTALVLCLGLLMTNAVYGEVVVEDGDTRLTRAELEYIVRNWSPEMRMAGADDLGDRLELINLALTAKKLAADADRLTPEDGDVYWKKEMMVRTVKREFMVEQFLRSIEVPDMSAVARERYLARPDHYAKMPEQRLSSHILVKCDVEAGCILEEAKQKAERLLARLESGESFEELAREYSDDKRSGAAGGRYDRWLDVFNKQVAPEYIEAVFALENVGDHTGVYRTRFGYHIIRLDEIRPEHILPFDAVEADIVAELEQEFKKLSAAAFDAKYRISDQARIKGPAVEEIFAPYRTQAMEPPAADDAGS